MIELVVVISVMGILAAAAMRIVDSGPESSRVEETRAEMNQLAGAIGGNPELSPTVTVQASGMWVTLELCLLI